MNSSSQTAHKCCIEPLLPFIGASATAATRGQCGEGVTSGPAVGQIIQDAGLQSIRHSSYSFLLSSGRSSEQAAEQIIQDAGLQSIRYSSYYFLFSSGRTSGPVAGKTIQDAGLQSIRRSSYSFKFSSG